MATTLNALTVEHLGQDATEQDLHEFKHWVRELMAADDSFTEAEAIDALWGDGDYLKAAERFGILTRDDEPYSETVIDRPWA